MIANTFITGNSWPVDAARLLSIAVGVAVLLWVLERWLRNGFGVYLALASFVSMGIIQEYQSIGEPFAVWRLPLYGAGLAGTLLYLWQTRRD